MWKRLQESVQQQHGWCLSIGGYWPDMFLVSGLIKIKYDYDYFLSLL